MKRLLCLLIIITLFTSLTAWDLKRQCDFPANFYNMDLVGSHVWAVGTAGAVVHSSDNGNTYQFVPNPAFDAVNNVYFDLNDVDFYDANHGIIVADQATLAMTADGGTTWTVNQDVKTLFSNTNGINSVVYLPSGKIMACGLNGVIVYSADNGVTWTAQTSPIITTLYSISLNEAGVGFVACNNASGTSKLLRTTDYGTTWTLVPITITNNPHLYGVRQFGSTVVVLGDKGFIGYSTDDGANFTCLNGVAGSTTKMQDVTMNGSVGYAVGWNSVIVKTTNNWQTTEIVTNNFGDYFEGIEFNANGELISSAWKGNLLKSVNNGVSWTEQTIPINFIYSTSIVNDEVWYLCGDTGNLLKTTDGGDTFTRLFIPGDFNRYYAVYFKNELEGFVTGKTTGKIYHTIDGGLTWTNFQVPGVAASKSYYRIIFLDDMNGFVMGVGDKNAKTTDGGLTWTVLGNVGLTSANNLLCAHWFDQNNGLAGAISGKLFKTNDGGANWTQMLIGTNDITDIHFKDANNGILTQKTGIIYYTSNGGMNEADWTLATESATDDLNGTNSDADGNFYAVGYSSGTDNYGSVWALIKSTDNGASWTQIGLPDLTFNKTRLTGIAIKNDQYVVYGGNQVIYSQNTATNPPVYATDLFFSEYVEGSSNNKAIEIFNGTGQPVNLGEYSVKLGSNGGAWGTTLVYNHTLAHNDVYIIANSAANATILALADTTSTVTFYNGDDALGLFHNDVLIDMIGVQGTDPGTSWGVAGVADATLNHTLIRKPTVSSPTTNWAESAGTNVDDSQWIVNPIDFITDLGIHTFTPGGGVPTVATPAFSPAPGAHLNPIYIKITCSTPGSTIYYTLDGTEPLETSTVYADSFLVTVNTTVKARAFAPELAPSGIATAGYTFPVVLENFAALRTQTPGTTTIYSVSSMAVLTFKQTFRNQKYFQDATGGILVDDMTGVLATPYNVGDGITNLTGTLSEFGGMLQFVPSVNPGPPTTVGNIISPQIVTPNHFVTNFEEFEAELVKIENLSFVNPTGNFANGTVYQLTNGTADTVRFRTTFYDVDYIGIPVYTTPVTVVGIFNSRVDGNYFTARSIADFTVITDFVAPQNLSYVLADGVVTLNWQAPAQARKSTRSLTGYKVYRNGTALFDTPIAELTYQDNTVVNGNTYTYYVTAVYTNPDGESAPSNSVVAALPVYLNSIAALRTQPVGTNTVYNLNSEVILTFAQTYRHQKFVQDASAAIMIDDLPGAITSAYNIGDGITGLSGKLVEFGGMLEFTPLTDPGTATSTGNVINPQIITISDLNTNFEDYESELVRVINVTIDSTGNFANGIRYPMHDASGNGYLRTTFYDMNYINTPIPTDAQHIIGICNSRADGNYLTPRTLADFQPATTNFNPPQNLTATPGNNFIDLAWQAPVPAGMVRNNLKKQSMLSRSLSGYKVYRNNILVTTLASTVTTYHDAEATNGGYYQYFITAIYANPDGESLPSNTETIMLPAYLNNIAALRAVEINPNLDYILTGNAVLTFKQTFRNQKYIQDASAAILIDDNNGIITTNYNLGDAIANIRGKLVVTGNMLQFVPVLNPGPPVSTGNVITPQVITMAEMNNNFEQYEAELIKINSVNFDVMDTFANNTVYAVHDASAAGSFRTSFPGVDYIGNDIPINQQHITGICNSTAEGNYFTARNSDDFVNIPPVFNPPTNLAVQNVNNQAVLTWNAPNPEGVRGNTQKKETNRSLTSFKIYRNNALLTTVPAAQLTYTDATVAVNIEYSYYLTAVYTAPNGESQPTAPVTFVGNNDHNPAVLNTKLGLNYPNPFNPSTSIEYSQKDDGLTVIDIYNISGQKVTNLVNKKQPAGNYKAVWNGRDASGKSVSSGIYFYKMKSGKYSSTRKMILMK